MPTSERARLAVCDVDQRSRPSREAYRGHDDVETTAYPQARLPPDVRARRFVFLRGRGIHCPVFERPRARRGARVIYRVARAPGDLSVDINMQPQCGRSYSDARATDARELVARALPLRRSAIVPRSRRLATPAPAAPLKDKA